LLLEYRVGSAIAAYERAVELMPDSREALLGLADTQSYFRHWGPSLATAQQGLRYYGEDPEFLRIAVAALVQLGKWTEALEGAKALQAMDSGLADVERTVAEIHARRGEFDLAEDLYRAALESDPSDAFAVKGLAFCQYGRGNLDGAVQTIMDFLKSDLATPENTPYVLWSGSGLGLRGFLMDAGRLSPPKLSRRKPRDWLPAESQDLLYAALPTLAVETIDADFDPLVEDGTSISSRLDAHEQVIRAWIATGELERAELAIAKHQSIVDDDPNLPRGFVQRQLYISAAFEFARGNVERAHELLGELFREGFVRLGTDEIQIYELQAAVLAELGQRQRAIEVLEDLLSVFASRALAHLQLAQLYEADGQFEAARASYDRSLDLWSEADREYPYPEQVRGRLGGL
jgi:tetratricopeptide (TPR) repeat protein